MHKLYLTWDSLRSSIWFVPSLLVITAVILALVLVEADTNFGVARLEKHWPRFFGAGAAGARDMLTVIASSMITVAGVAFSIMVVALALASSQYTSRILRNFMRDRGNQTVLGVFMGVFAYCLTVLRTIRSADEGAFIPSLAVFVAMLLAFVAIGFFIFFIHHVSSSIQATSIIQAAAHETMRTVDRMFPNEIGEAETDSQLNPSMDSEAWHAIPSRRTGYIQSVDANALISFALARNLVIRMERAIGEFVVEGMALVSIARVNRHDEESASKLNALYSIGHHRTTLQDAGYGIRQIVDVALKALSPGINDTTTAVICVNYLGAILARLAKRQIEHPYQSHKGKILVIARSSTFADLLGEAFDQIRQNAESNVAVTVHLLETLEVITGMTLNNHRRQALRQHAELLADASQRGFFASHDRAKIKATADRLLRKLSCGSEQ